MKLRIKSVGNLLMGIAELIFLIIPADPKADPTFVMMANSFFIICMCYFFYIAVEFTSDGETRL